MEHSHLLGWGKLLKTVGTMAFVGGLWLDAVLLAWASVGLLGIAFALSGVGKIVHYGEETVTRRERLLLSASWIALSVVLMAFLWGFLQSRFGDGGGPLWTLAIAGGGLALVHYGLQIEYLDRSGEDAETAADADADAG